MWYDKYIGTPFKHLGNDLKTGIDCFNLVLLIYKEQLNIDYNICSADFCSDEEDWYNNASDRPFFNFEDSIYNMEKVSEPQIYDIILFSIGATNCINHCAIYVDTNRILNIMENSKSRISVYGRYYKQYTQGIYRCKQNLIN